jgi:molybdopterin-containing oxidoreductase family iron-sulfur binding subunit
MSACLPQPQEKIVPYVEAPEELVPGRPDFYATAMELDGFGRGLLVESQMGRPLKVEGNPNHPLNLGATDAFSQASILDLYDPKRAQVITSAGEIQTREAFLSVITEALEVQQSSGGAGLRVLTGTVTSPTFASQLRALLESFPQARWHQYEAVGRGNIKAGAQLAFGQPVEPQYRISAADVILTLDADFLSREQGSLRYLREFASRRQPTTDQSTMNRLYVVESSFTTTGASADHRLALNAGKIEVFARSLAARLGVIEAVPPEQEEAIGWLDALAKDLTEHKGASLIIPGFQQPEAVHALAHAMNLALGNVGNTVFFTSPVEAEPVDQAASLVELVDNLNAGRVELLVIFSDNPAYNAPADLDFATALSLARLSVYWGAYYDETARLCHWHLPASHFLESWSDTRSFDGVASIVQPLIQPLYSGTSKHELLATMLGEPGSDGYQLVQRFWQSRFLEAGGSEASFEGFWRQSLRDGIIPDTAASVLAGLELNAGFASSSTSPAGQPQSEASGPESAEAEDPGLEIIFEPDPTIWDGRFFNNAWLQELPKPLTKLTWENAALLSPGTAFSQELRSGEIVELVYKGRSVRAPVLILPGLPDGSVIVPLGYGQRGAGEASSAHGFNAYTIRTSDQPWFGAGLELRKTGSRQELATTQEHFSIEGRHLVRSASLAEFQINPDFAQEFEAAPIESGEGIETQPGSQAGDSQQVHEPPSLYPEFEYEGNAWGMAINLSSCTGCNACVVACQAENNIPVVGRDQVLAGREMHWLRIDTYFENGSAGDEVHFQPMLCMHCEKAPCEPVCPVGATVHSPEGLNEQVYNRCIGTRYCSHNCPYKVRRFNFYNYLEEDLIPLKLLHNPNVTVRSRGVMEKCTYCVQRINAARIEARREGREIDANEIVTACQQACPTQAIVFGDINNSESQVSQLKGLPLNYSLLGELGTQPRTTYLAKVKNPNPNMVP